MGATDGVIEINNARALAGGVTPGDTPGYPVSINLPGSYRLTSNLDITSINPPNTNAIEVNVDDVTIDLAGFEILGPTSCGSGQPVTGCAPTGTGNGITTTSMLGKKGLRVRNGTIRGMGANGLRGPSLVERVRVESNGSNGIDLNVSGEIVNPKVESCEVLQNGSVGITVSPSSGAFIRSNTVSGNASNGIVAVQAFIVDNVVNRNGGVGITTFPLGSALIRGNQIVSNTGLGLQMQGTGTTIDAFGGNILESNNAAAVGTPQTSGGLAIDTNICKGTTTCP